MADVFLSYARGDRSAAERLARAIGEAGLSVWWDRHIKGGAEFSRDIERQLDAAARVLVLWSKEAVDSRWVRDEASVAADSGRLVGATLDGTPPPLGFRQFQTIDLSDWAVRGAAIPPELAEALEVEALRPAAGRASTASLPRRRLLAAGVGAMLLAGAGAVAIVRPGPFAQIFSGDRQNEALSLAIMPFVAPAGESAHYLGAGLSSALADSLAPLSGLKITASTSTHAIARKGLTAPEIAKTLGITHLVEGDVQKLGNRYALSVRLIEAKSSEQIWARSFEGGPDELQTVKTRMARELAGALSARLGAGRGDIVERRNVDPRAYEAYLRALERVTVRDKVEARLEAIKQFHLAASIQPDFADAHAGYAYLMALSMPDQLGMPWSEIIAQQRSATERALSIDPDNDLALVAKATALQNFEGDVARSIAIGQRVLRRTPNSGAAHYSLAASFLMAGQARKALDHLDQAIERDPFDMLLRRYREKILISLGDYEAVRRVGKCGEECEDTPPRGWFLAMLGFASPAQYREDFPLILERFVARGREAHKIARDRAIADALILGRPYRFAPVKQERDMDFPTAAVAARLTGFEEGLHYARVAAQHHQPDGAVDILNEGRVTFTPEQRADPRYHQLFRHPKLVGIATARRKAGVNAGLPLFPVKAYTGP